jgi:high-affinity Fe2+/Pb2+ permease
MAAWPKMGRLAVIPVAASAGGYVFGRLGLRLFFGILGIIAVVVAIGIAYVVWRFA